MAHYLLCPSVVEPGDLAVVPNHHREPSTLGSAARQSFTASAASLRAFPDPNSMIFDRW
jgi:hypothetical protein